MYVHAHTHAQDLDELGTAVNERTKLILEDESSEQMRDTREDSLAIKNYTMNSPPVTAMAANSPASAAAREKLSEHRIIQVHTYI